MRLADYIEANEILKAALEKPEENYRLIMSLIRQEFNINDEAALLRLNKLEGKYKAVGPKIMKAILNPKDPELVGFVFNYIFELYPNSELEAAELMDQLITKAEQEVM